MSFGTCHSMRLWRKPAPPTQSSRRVSLSIKFLDIFNFIKKLFFVEAIFDLKSQLWKTSICTNNEKMHQPSSICSKNVTIENLSISILFNPSRPNLAVFVFFLFVFHVLKQWIIFSLCSHLKHANDGEICNYYIVHSLASSPHIFYKVLENWQIYFNLCGLVAFDSSSCATGGLW